jgi:CcmD family protein
MTTLLHTLLIVLSSAVLAAQPPGPGQGGFVPIDELPATESFPAAPLVIAAYAFAWIAVFVYVWTVWRRLQRVERELADVARQAGGPRP